MPPSIVLIEMNIQSVVVKMIQSTVAAEAEAALTLRRVLLLLEEWAERDEKNSSSEDQKS